MSTPRKSSNKRPAASDGREVPRIELERQVGELTKRVAALRASLGTGTRKTSELRTLLVEVTNQREEIRIQNDQLNESQALLEESRDRYANLYDFAPVACLTLCEHGIIREINLTGASLLGHWRTRLLERPLLQFVDRAHRRLLMEHLRLCREGQQTVTTELTICDAGGRIFPAELTSVRAASDEPGIPHFRSVILDLTERKRAEMERTRLADTEEKEHLLKTVLQSLPVGVRVLDADGNIVLFNDSSDKIWGRPLRSLGQWADLGARSVRTGQPLKTIGEWPGWLALKAGQTILNELIEIPHRADGNGDGKDAANGAEESRFINESAVPLRDDSHAVTGAVLVSEDVTSQILSQRRLRHAKETAETANRLKDEFLAIASHELRTPISSVLLWIHLLRKTMDNEKGRAEALDMVEQSAKAQSHLINDLLDVARLETGKLELQVAVKDLRPTILTVVDSVRPTAKVSGIGLTVNLDPKPVQAMIDTDRLRQILVNVLGNALKFTPTHGHITVSLGAENGQAKIDVADTGKGIATDFLPFVFDRFRQGDVTMTRQHGGMGLGLTISRQLAEMHGGKLTAKSDGPGKGSTFTLTLPLAMKAAKARSKARSGRSKLKEGMAALTVNEAMVPGSGGTGVLSGVRVLLVEDEDATRAALAKLLRVSGAKVTAAATAAEACAAFERAGARRPDVLLSDISMPDMDGYTLLGQIRSLEARNKLLEDPVPAIALTARARAGDAERAVQAGFAVHLAKPVEPQQLISVLLDVTARSS